MEERRLKCILSHLTPRSPSLVGNTDILKGQSKTGAIEENWSSPIKVPDDLQWPTRRHAEELKAHRYTSESRASFDMYESRHLSLLKGTTMRGTTSHPIASSSSEEVVDVQFNRAAEIEPTDFLIASSGQVTGNSLSKELLGWCNSPCLELTLQRCRGLLRSRAPTFEVGGECPCISRNDEAYGGALWKTNIGGYNTDTTGFKTYKFNSGQLHCNHDAQLHHSCTPSAAVHLESDMGCKLHDQHEAQQTNECQADERANVKDDSKTIGTKRLNNLPGGIQDSQHEAVVSDHQAHTTTHEIFQGMVKQNLRSSRDMHRPDSQAVGIGSDVPGSMTVSRNNAMTGQRRPTVEDCIFCLIIQGQSPAFKLYEDEMCACILDVHPLSHGHSLIIPKAHFPSLELTPPEVAAAMCAIVPFISMAIMEATSCEGLMSVQRSPRVRQLKMLKNCGFADSFNLLVNSGKAAGQVVFHTHFHIIPRRSGDNLWRSESACRRALALGRETSLLVQQIRHKLSEKRL